MKHESFRPVVMVSASFHALPLLALIFAAMTCSPSPARAETEQVSMAREYYSRGEQLFQRGDFVGALRQFRAAYRAAPHPVVLKSEAECESRLGNHRAAVELYERYLRERPDATDRSQVEARIAELRSRPGQLRITSTPAGAQVLVDGRPYDAATPTTLDLLPGPHSIEVRLAGHEPAAREVQVAFDAESTLSFSLTSSQQWAAEPDFTETLQPAAAAETSPATLRLSPSLWVAAAFCAVGLVTGTVSGSLALVDEGRFNDAVAGASPRAELEEIASRGRTEALAADVGFGVAVVAGIAGIVLVVLEALAGEEDGSLVIAPTGGPSRGLAATVGF